MISMLRHLLGIAPLLYCTAASAADACKFEVLDEQRWARLSYQQDEHGSWRPQFRLEAKRLPCE